MSTYIVTRYEGDPRNRSIPRVITSKWKTPAEIAYNEEVAKGNFVRLVEITFVGRGKGGRPIERLRHEGKRHQPS